MLSAVSFGRVQYKGDLVSRYLVTGAAGFIGAHFVDYLLQQSGTEYIAGLDNLSYSQQY